MNLIKRTDNKITDKNVGLLKSILLNHIWILTLTTVGIMGGCHDDNTHELKLVDADWNNVKMSIFLNGELLPDATVQFSEIPGSDSISMVLHGVHPNKPIVMTMNAIRDKNDNFLFKGTRNDPHELQLEADGEIASVKSMSGQSKDFYTCFINITYSVPFSVEYKIPFTHDDNGFCHHEYWGGSAFQSWQDSCEYICRRINSEIGNHLKTIVFDFKSNGQMTFTYTTAKNDVNTDTFRYWLNKEWQSGNMVAVIENSYMFYQRLLCALIPMENQAQADGYYIPEFDTAKLFLSEKDWFGNFKKLGRSITLVDDIHHQILPYFYNYLLKDGAWNEHEKDCFQTMYDYAKSFYSPEQNPSFYNGFGWAFCESRIGWSD